LFSEATYHTLDVDSDEDVDFVVDADTICLPYSETDEYTRTWCEGGTSARFNACMEYTCLESFDSAFALSLYMLDPCTMQYLLDMGCWVCLQNHCPDQHDACMAAGC